MMWDDYNFVGENCEWPPYIFEGEGYDFTGQDDFHEVDIAAELLRLAVCLRSVAEAECLRRPLEYISHMFRTTTLADVHDDLEPCSATALRQVDELLRQQTAEEAPPLPAKALEELKVLQRLAQDVAVLANSRSIDQQILQVISGKTSTPTSLMRRGRFWTGFGPTWGRNLI